MESLMSLEGASEGPRDAERFYCPHSGCSRSFAELWRLKVHYRAPPDVRGSGKERGHGMELAFCPKCGKDLKPGKHHVACTATVKPTSSVQKGKRKQDQDGIESVPHRQPRVSSAQQLSLPQPTIQPLATTHQINWQMNGQQGMFQPSAPYMIQQPPPHMPFLYSVNSVIQHNVARQATGNGSSQGGHMMMGTAEQSSFPQPGPMLMSAGPSAYPLTMSGLGASAEVSRYLNQAPSFPFYQNQQQGHGGAVHGGNVPGYPYSFQGGQLGEGQAQHFSMPNIPSTVEAPSFPFNQDQQQGHGGAVHGGSVPGYPYSSQGGQGAHIERGQATDLSMPSNPRPIEGPSYPLQQDQPKVLSGPEHGGNEVGYPFLSPPPTEVVAIKYEDEFDELVNRLPSPPPLPPDFMNFMDGAKGGTLFNFGQFNQKMPSSQPVLQGPNQLVKDLTQESLDLAESNVVYEAHDDGGMMQLLFGVANEAPTMATIHLHQFRTAQNEDLSVEHTDPAEGHHLHEDDSYGGLAQILDGQDESTPYQAQAQIHNSMAADIGEIKNEF